MVKLFAPTVKATTKFMTSLLGTVLTAAEGRADAFTTSGGTADSLYMRHHINIHLGTFNDIRHKTTKLVCAAEHDSLVAVAIGNVLRGRDKDHGPRRQLHFNVGVARYIPCEGHAKEGVYAQTSYPSTLDGARYIGPVIDWIIKKKVSRRCLGIKNDRI